MARCTAPVNGHRTASGRANCPACGGRYGGYSYRSPYSYSPPSRSYSSSYGSGGSRKSKARWSRTGSTLLYTPAEIRTLTPVRESIEERASIPDLRDVFLCHAWDDRKNGAKQLCDLLEAKGVSVWFSEKDVVLGAPLMREIDKGLANSRVGVVLVTPSFLKRIQSAGIADKELSVLLRRNLLVPITHGTSFEELNNVSPMLASRTGLDTTEEPMDEIAAKLSELVNIETELVA